MTVGIQGAIENTEGGSRLATEIVGGAVAAGGGIAVAAGGLEAAANSVFLFLLGLPTV